MADGPEGPGGPGDMDPAATDLDRRALTFREFVINRLEHLVMLESPSDAPALLKTINEDLAAAYSRVGARVERVAGPAADHLVCHWAATDPAESDGHVLLIGHSDTVFPAGTTQQRPFVLHPDGDTVTGPGVYDMKGTLVEIELAMRLLIDAGRPLRREVRLVIVNDEETGSVDGRRVVAAHSEGAVAAIGLESPMPDGGLKIGRRGVARVEIVVEGVEAHAGLEAAKGVSAIDELIDQLSALRGRWQGATDASLNIGAISGGTRANVVAGHARAEVGLRFGTPAAERALLADLEQLQPVRVGATVRTRRLSHRPAWAPDLENPVAAELADLAARAGWQLSTGAAGGAGDTNLTGAAGIPTVDGLGPEGSGAHAVTENASISSLLQRAALMAHYLSAK